MWKDSGVLMIVGKESNRCCQVLGGRPPQKITKEISSKEKTGHVLRPHQIKSY